MPIEAICVQQTCPRKGHLVQGRKLWLDANGLDRHSRRSYRVNDFRASFLALLSENGSQQHDERNAARYFALRGETSCWSKQGGWRRRRQRSQNGSCEQGKAPQVPVDAIR